MATRFYHDNQLRALKEAVRNVFWTKSEFKRLFDRCNVPHSALAGVIWDGNTWNIVDHVLETLNRHSAGVAPLRALAEETLRYKDGNHLRWAGAEKVAAATASLAQLRKMIGEHSEELRKKEEARRVAEKSRLAQKDGELFRGKLGGLQKDYLQWFSENDASRRGFAFEKILSALFDLNDLAPAGSFRRTGEQIDGAFKLDNENFILEAKWQADPVNLADLRDLDGAVNSTLETTLGIFISVNGFSQTGLEGYLLGNRPRIICADGSDLTLILEGRIALPDLLRRKKELASQRRIINVSAQDILAGKY